MKEKKRKQPEIQKNIKHKYKKFMIRDPLVTLLYVANIQFIFFILKGFIDFLFVKTVRRISFQFIHPVQLFPPYFFYFVYQSNNPIFYAIISICTAMFMKTFLFQGLLWNCLFFHTLSCVHLQLLALGINFVFLLPVFVLTTCPAFYQINCHF